MKRTGRMLSKAVLLASVAFTSSAMLHVSYAVIEMEKPLGEERTSEDQDRDSEYQYPIERPDHPDQNESTPIPRDRDDENRRQHVRDQIQTDDAMTAPETEINMLFNFPLPLLEALQLKGELKVTSRNISELPGIAAQTTTDITGEPKSLNDWYVCYERGTGGGKSQLIIKQGKSMEEDYQVNLSYCVAEMVVEEVLNRLDWMNPSFVEAIVKMNENAKNELLSKAYKDLFKNVPLDAERLKNNSEVVKQIFRKSLAYLYGGYDQFLQENANELYQYLKKLDWQEIKSRTSKTVGTKKTKVSFRPMNTSSVSPTNKVVENKPFKMDFASERLLDEHYQKHSREFGRITKAQYRKQAQDLCEEAKTGGRVVGGTVAGGRIEMKLDPATRDALIFKPSTNEFAVISTEGKIRTYFKPDSYNYWSSRPGTAIKTPYNFFR